MFDINQDVVSIDNNRNIKFLGKNLADISLKIGSNIKKLKSHYIIF